MANFGKNEAELNIFLSHMEYGRKIIIQQKLHALGSEYRQHSENFSSFRPFTFLVKTVQEFLQNNETRTVQKCHQK